MAYTINPRMPKVRWEAAELVLWKGWSTRKAARHVGYSQAAVVRWVKKAQKRGYGAIPTHSSRPHHHPKELPHDIVDAICTVRREVKRSAEVIHKILGERDISVSLSSVKRTINRWGLTKKRSPWKRYHASFPRPFVEKAGDLVQVDTIHLLTNEQKKIYVFTLLDVCSRWAYARAYEKANTNTALDFLRRAQGICSFPFRHLQSDHGSEFSTQFTERSGIQHRHSRVRRPNDNAHLERFNRTIQEECIDGISKSVRIINKTLPAYLKYYNEQRYHFGINLKTPMQVITSY